MKVTLLTGASSGIGEAFAWRLAAEQHNLVLVARSEAKLQRLCAELMQRYAITAQYVALDLTVPGADAQLFAETEKRQLDVTWLINNAGIGSAGDFTQLDLASELAMMTLNNAVLVALTHRYPPQMRARRSGTIVEVASLAAFQPTPFMAVYAATKIFVRSFTAAIAEENRPFNIRIMLLCPGATETGFFDAAHLDSAAKTALVGKALQTPGQVVAAAMRGLAAGKRVTISGFTNRLMARAATFLPNSLITFGLAKAFRPTFQSPRSS